jgi:hypothetical protein
MPELQMARGSHTVASVYGISRVQVSQDDELSLIAFSPDAVKINGASDQIRAETDGNKSTITTVGGLSQGTTGAWTTYHSGDPKITSVQIDDATIDTRASTTRVEIYF